MPYTVIGAIGELVLSDSATASNGNKCVLMSLNNEVMFCDNIKVTNYSSGEEFAVLPDESMCPETSVAFPVKVTTKESALTAYEHDNGLIAAHLPFAQLTVSDTGTLSINRNLDEGTVYLCGLSFTANSKYYTPEIGNIYNNGTSPLQEV